MGSCRDDLLEPEMLEGIVHHRMGSFGRVALAMQGGGNGIEEAKLGGGEPMRGWRGRSRECRELFEGVQAWHEAASVGAK